MVVCLPVRSALFRPPQCFETQTLGRSVDRAEKLPSLARVVSIMLSHVFRDTPSLRSRPSGSLSASKSLGLDALSTGKCPEALSSDRQEFGQTEMSKVKANVQCLAGGILGVYVPLNSDWMGLLWVP